jgi:hypothetical protein
VSYLPGPFGGSPEGEKPDTTQALQDARPLLSWFTDFFTKPAYAADPMPPADGSVVLYPPTGPGPSTSSPAAARTLDIKKVAIGAGVFVGGVLLVRAALKGRR